MSIDVTGSDLSWDAVQQLLADHLETLQAVLDGMADGQRDPRVPMEYSAAAAAQLAGTFAVQVASLLLGADVEELAARAVDAELPQPEADPRVDDVAAGMELTRLMAGQLLAQVYAAGIAFAGMDPRYQAGATWPSGLTTACVNMCTVAFTPDDQLAEMDLNS